MRGYRLEDIENVDTDQDVVATDHSCENGHLAPYNASLNPKISSNWLNAEDGDILKSLRKKRTCTGTGTEMSRIWLRKQNVYV